nr:PqqD family protein [uncultured Brevundimonas sp.]
MAVDVSGTFAADPEVVASDVDGGAALLDLRSSQYYGLNPVGALVWARLQTPQTLDQLAFAVAEAFDVDPAVCREDIAQLLGTFDQAGLIRRDV